MLVGSIRNAPGGVDKNIPGPDKVVGASEDVMFDSVTRNSAMPVVESKRIMITGWKK